MFRKEIGKVIFSIFLFLSFFGLYVMSARTYETPAYITLERDWDRADKESDEPPATFPHLVHQEQFYCYTCHPSVFKIGGNKMVHDDFDNGKFCGACHNGVITWHVDDAEDCEVCHR